MANRNGALLVSMQTSDSLSLFESVAVVAMVVTVVWVVVDSSLLEFVALLTNKNTDTANEIITTV